MDIENSKDRNNREHIEANEDNGVKLKKTWKRWPDGK